MKEGDLPQAELADAVTFKDIKAAAGRLAPVAERTPVLTPAIVDELTGAKTLLKCESFQRIGAFKFRGAYNALSQLDHKAREQGVLTYSSGNHAQAMALAAALLHTPVVVVMPGNASPIKLNATREYVARAKAEGARFTALSDAEKQQARQLIQPAQVDGWKTKVAAPAGIDADRMQALVEAAIGKYDGQEIGRAHV